MARNNYDHMESTIKSFFNEKGYEISLEPHGSRGPDLESRCNRIVGEIKHKTELMRDLKSNYWRHWN